MNTLVHMANECNLTIYTRSKVGLKYHTNQSLVTAVYRVIIDRCTSSRPVATYDMSNQTIK